MTHLTPVCCDFCNKDFTNSDACGGILFGSYGTCPECAPRIETQAKLDGESQHIKARCPVDKPFAQWIREDVRHPDDDGIPRIYDLSDLSGPWGKSV